ncbi:hypothetical protein ANCDUO_09856 [Ancylostoma duodenale]|uniref:Reverse transcriptase domain-containing protein n=1 Tax=Ancylostoma duodenale TaxID=51022 RepID=A0A0C2GSA4_9BILA|nr:hypothetical protein ANCDUO_09856 [Ancylostoma duodenale]
MTIHKVVKRLRSSSLTYKANRKWSSESPGKICRYLQIINIPKIVHCSSRTHFSKAVWNEYGQCVNGIQLTNLRFADDVVLIAKSAEELQIMMNDLDEHSRSCGLKINASKTKVMTRGGSTIILKGVELECVDSFIYLGRKVSLNRDSSGEIVFDSGPNTPLLSEQASMDSLPINDAQSHPLPSSAELVKTSPRNSVKKTAVNETDAAKRNRLDGAISQLQARARVSSSPLQKKGCAENLQDPAPPVKEPQKASSTKEPQKPAPKKRRQRKTKENAAVGAKKTELDDNTKKKDEWKEHVRGLVKELNTLP